MEKEVSINFAQFINNQKGNAIVAVLLGTIGVVAVSYMTLQRASINKKNEMIATADKDVDDAAMQIGSYFLSPANCNANFVGAPTANNSTLSTAIKACASGATCTAAGSGINTVFIRSSSDTGNWSANDTGLTNKVRVVRVEYSISSPQTVGPIGTRKPATVKITVSFQKNLGFNSSGTRHTSIVKREFEAFLVSASFSGPPSYTLTPLANFAGCARSPSSTVVYGL